MLDGLPVHDQRSKPAVNLAEGRAQVFASVSEKQFKDSGNPTPDLNVHQSSPQRTPPLQGAPQARSCGQDPRGPGTTARTRASRSRAPPQAGRADSRGGGGGSRGRRPRRPRPARSRPTQRARSRPGPEAPRRPAPAHHGPRRGPRLPSPPRPVTPLRLRTAVFRGPWRPC